MKIRIKKLSDKAVIPAKAHATDAGFDLVATRMWYDEYGNICYGTDLAFEIPAGFVGYIFPRSSNAKKQLVLSNSVGVIDAGYRGEVTFKFKPSLALDGNQCVTYKKRYDIHQVGDHIGHLIIMPIPEIEFEEGEKFWWTVQKDEVYSGKGTEYDHIKYLKAIVRKELTDGTNL